MKPGEIRALFKHQLDPERARELKEQMLAGVNYRQTRIFPAKQSEPAKAMIAIPRPDDCGS